MKSSGRAPLCLLPGPVEVHPAVRRAFARAPISHRSEAFGCQMAQVQAQLCSLTGARAAAVLLGSGTMANDVVAAQLSLLNSSGLVLSNGEFGERLVDHASRARLCFERLALPWGQAFDLDEVGSALQRSRAGWLWLTHCETSTGLLNDVAGLGRLCESMGVRLCLDCVSSINTVPLDLSRVHLASASSGKGIAALPGLAIVFFREQVLAAPSLPRVLDLGLYAAHGVPFTHSSNLLGALHAALERALRLPPLGDKAELGVWMRSKLRAQGFRLVAEESAASPVVVTLALEPGVCARRMGEQASCEGFELSFRSAYLVERNWIQVCGMGEVQPEQIEPLFPVLGRAAST